MCAPGSHTIRAHLVLTARGPFTGLKVGQVHPPALSASGQAGVSAHVQPKAGALCALRPRSFSCRRLLEARIDVTLCSTVQTGSTSFSLIMANPPWPAAKNPRLLRLRRSGPGPRRLLVWDYLSSFPVPGLPLQRNENTGPMCALGMMASIYMHF